MYLTDVTCLITVHIVGDKNTFNLPIALID